MKKKKYDLCFSFYILGDGIRILGIMTVNSSLTNFSDASERFNNTGKAFVYLVGALLSFVTISGNLLVAIAYCSNPRLKTITNLFIFSLSISDITVGLFSINLYTIYMNNMWQLGEVFCNVWLCLDYGCCQASVIHLLIICTDRYLALKKPLKYRSKRTWVKAKAAIVTAWVIAFVQWVPFIIGYPYVVGERTVPKNNCYVQFLFENAYITIITASLAYYGPVFIMGFFYQRVYSLIKQREKELKDPKNNNSYIVVGNAIISRVAQIGARLSMTDIRPRAVKSRASVPPRDGKFKKLALILKQKKATKLLIGVFLAFAISWLPYHIFACISPFCPTFISKRVWEFGYVLCYLNSTINPTLYALGSQDFRKTFRALFSKRRRAFISFRKSQVDVSIKSLSGVMEAYKTNYNDDIIFGYGDDLR